MALLKDKLSRTRKIFNDKIKEAFKSPKKREDILNDLMESLLLTDFGIAASEKIISNLKEKSKKTDSFPAVKQLLADEINGIFSKFSSKLNTNPSGTVVMFVGTNGGGKTTSLAKTAYHFKKKGEKVLMVAADTFRAAAQEQLSEWGKKLNIPVIKSSYGSDPAAVTYDAIQSFKAKQYQILLIDTAGRLHTNINLMSELEKIKKIIAREIQGAPHEVLLVLDASIGQNALHQAKEFSKFSGLTGIFLSKLDGTAKGGSVISIVDELDLPIKLIGIGENEKDMLEFSPQEFTQALLS
ncbi:MAG: signal recognition particle-docking protein FtsY [Candidatus Aminicenantes bacterium]|nr:signal recognition particle-docking protein FtsY [Candidatus Aminicenantes bacterium]HHF51327.1 signal recognition particle-docking protein FtsY [Candidatus Aminicenantes bacterium]